jgi:hypothetical protein
MGVQDAVASAHPNTDSSSTNSANTDHASDKPLLLVALSATEAVGWEDLEAKVSSYLSPQPAVLGLTIRRSQGRELTQHLSRPVSRLRKPLAAATASTPSPPATRHGR